MQARRVLVAIDVRRANRPAWAWAWAASRSAQLLRADRAGGRRGSGDVHRRAHASVRASRTVAALLQREGDGDQEHVPAVRARKVTRSAPQMQSAFRSSQCARVCTTAGGVGWGGWGCVCCGGHSVASFGLTVYTQAATSSSSSDRIVSVLLSLHKCTAACACARTCARAQRRFN